jgi:hypothetical protein
MFERVFLEGWKLLWNQNILYGVFSSKFSDLFRSSSGNRNPTLFKSFFCICPMNLMRTVSIAIVKRLEVGRVKGQGSNLEGEGKKT